MAEAECSIQCTQKEGLTKTVIQNYQDRNLNAFREQGVWLSTKRLAYHGRLCVFPCTTHNTELLEHNMDEIAPRFGQSFGSQRLKPTNLGKPIFIHTQEKGLIH